MAGRIITFFVGFLILALVGSCRIVNEIWFDRGCEGFLKQASDANTVDVAKDRLAQAIKYLDDNNLTSGYTSIVYRTPSDDVGFWYNNLKASMNELESVPEDANQLLRSNLLIKLRETLLDHGQSGDSVTSPNGISIYPNNMVFCLATIFGAVLLVGAVLMLLPE